MGRSKYILALGLVLGVGTTIEMLKRTEPDHDRMARLTRLQSMMDDGRPVYKPSVTKTIKAMFRGAGPTLAGMTTKLDPDAAHTDAKDDTKKDAKKDSKTESKKDPKKDPKKDGQKKKKKKKDNSVPSGLETTTTDEDELDESPVSGGTSAMQGGAMAGYVAAQPAFSNVPKTVQEWETYLFENPSYEKASRFIKYYQVGEFDASVFYHVVEDMLGEGDEKLREYGVMALGSTPSVPSFAMLSQVVNQEQGLTKLKSQVQVYLAMYTRLEYVRYLGQALTSDNGVYANAEAVRLIQVAAELHLKTNSPSSSGTPSRTTASASLTSYFRSLVQVLSQVSTSAGNESIRQAAQMAATNLQTLLSTAQAS